MNISINSFLSMSCVDGEGVRSVFFVQGCPLRCPYCHNPETQTFETNQSWSVNDVIKTISKYSPYYGEYGGITISGGEPLYQIDAVTEIFRRCKEELGVSTCLETSGVFPNRSESKLDELLALTDHVYCDYKFMVQGKTPTLNHKWSAKTDDFLKRCLPEKTIVRTVVVPDINNNKEYITALATKVRQIGNFKIELLPFKKFCVTKYKELHRRFVFEYAREATKTELWSLQNLVDTY